jgi:RNA polymerase sigma-70 factor (ECF subfamily)
MRDITNLFYRYRDEVYRLALSYTRSPQEAEDVCQTVFLKLLENPGITPGKEKAWLTRAEAILVGTADSNSGTVPMLPQSE